MNERDYIESLFTRIKILNETIWEDKARRPKIETWLSNFNTESEKKHALHLLSEFMYFGSVQVRQLLKALYRDLYRYPIVRDIRLANGSTLDETTIEPEYHKKLYKTKFFGVGNPSESGAHLLYFFRQENNLSKTLFIPSEEIFDYSTGIPQLKNPGLEYYVFIDDFCGSGSQAKGYLGRIASEIKRLKPTAQIFYLMLIGTTDGIKNVVDTKLFDEVSTVVEFDKTFKCFSDDSRHFDSDNAFQNKVESKDMAYRYGLPLIEKIIRREYPLLTEPEIKVLADKHALGFNDCQLLLGFHHNTPDNSLPITWYDEDDGIWNPIFKRYNKKYSM